MAQDIVLQARDTWIETLGSHDYVPQASRCMYRIARLQNNFAGHQRLFHLPRKLRILNLCLSPRITAHMGGFPIHSFAARVRIFPLPFLFTYSIIMRTGRILGSRRTRQQVGPQKFALSVKARFNPCRDSAGCTIVMRWQRRLKGYFVMTKRLSL
jgi:hypothetical protein